MPRGKFLGSVHPPAISGSHMAIGDQQGSTGIIIFISINAPLPGGWHYIAHFELFCGWTAQKSAPREAYEISTYGQA